MIYIQNRNNKRYVKYKCDTMCYIDKDMKDTVFSIMSFLFSVHILQYESTNIHVNKKGVYYC